MLLSNNCTYGANGEWACASRGAVRSKEGFFNNSSMGWIVDPPEQPIAKNPQVNNQIKVAAKPVPPPAPAPVPVACPAVPSCAPSGAPSLPGGTFFAWNRAGKFVTKEAQGVGITPGAPTQAVPLNYNAGNKRINMQGVNMCLDVTGSDQRDQANVIWWPCHSYPNQQWVRDGQGRLRPQHAPTKCLDIDKGLNNKPDQLVIKTCADNRPNQVWEAM